MLTYDDLNKQNDRITELTNVLNVLLSDRGLCDAQVTCDLFFDFVDRVKEHLELQNKHVYRKLLNQSDPRARNTAANFMSGENEIKKVFATYLKKWCSKRGKELRIGDYDAFAKETEDMFNLVLDRIQDESEKLFPMVREVTGERVLLVA
ncbi:MAG: hemerythrin domain-containing protein [Gammaproteobacteria bacterium]|jgi:succinate dehydrogenase flavin-adding protein (antitoxin of CptAB toxin-antitoxin module)